MNFLKKKIVFLIFKNNYRLNALGNFAKTNFYDKFIVINLSGRIKSVIGKLFYKLNIGKFISIDGDPFLYKQNNSINIWFTGPKLRIKSQYINFANNYVNIINPAIVEKDNYFHIYPIIKTRKICFKKARKIIFMGKFFFEPYDEIYFNHNKLLDLKTDILMNFKVIDEKKFWSDRFNDDEIQKKFDNYKIIKTFLRTEILNRINKEFKNHFCVFGTSNEKKEFKILKPVYDLNKIKKIYQGNICIDTGSILGSVTFAPRAIQILESGGLLLQTHQHDSKEKLKEIYSEITSNSINQLLEQIDILLTNHDKCVDYVNKTDQFLIGCRKKISDSLNNAFNIKK